MSKSASPPKSRGISRSKDCKVTAVIVLIVGALIGITMVSNDAGAGWAVIGIAALVALILGAVAHILAELEARPA